MLYRPLARSCRRTATISDVRQLALEGTTFLQPLIVSALPKSQLLRETWMPLVVQAFTRILASSETSLQASPRSSSFASPDSGSYFCSSLLMLFTEPASRYFSCYPANIRTYERRAISMSIFIYVHRSTKLAFYLHGSLASSQGSCYEARYHIFLRKGGNSLHGVWLFELLESRESLSY
jgi:hypothetical protein